MDGDYELAATAKHGSTVSASVAAYYTDGDRLAPASASTAEHAPCAGDEYELLCRFSLAYAAYHGYVGVVVCVAGFAMNLLNAVILSRRQLMCPTNAILISISAADMATIAVFAPYLVVFFVLTGDGGLRTSRTAAQYTLLFAHVGLVSHIASTWLTVALAAFRCKCVLARSSIGSGYCTYGRVWATVAAVAAASVLLASPQYIYLHVEQTPTGEWYVGDVRSNATACLDRRLRDVELWCVATLAKIGPCVILAVLSALLIRAMAESKAALSRWKRFERRGGSESQRRGSKDRQAQRTTAMLVAVVAIFGVVESPQALLLFLSQLLGERFYARVYVRLADLADLLTIVNSSTNFVIYCAMSKQFRGVVRSLVLRAPPGGGCSGLLPRPSSRDEELVPIDTIASTSRGPASSIGDSRALGDRTLQPLAATTRQTS